jgi:NADH-quinone oxidoreductase subunit K
VDLYVFASMFLFTVGLVGVLTKRNALLFFLSIEMMLNSANLLFVSFSNRWGNEIGHVWVFFVLLIAAAEAAVGLAIIVQTFRCKQVVDLDQYNVLKG